MGGHRFPSKRRFLQSRLQNSQSGAFSSELEGELGITRIPGYSLKLGSVATKENYIYIDSKVESIWSMFFFLCLSWEWMNKSFHLQPPEQTLGIIKSRRSVGHFVSLERLWVWGWGLELKQVMKWMKWGLSVLHVESSKHGRIKGGSRLLKHYHWDVFALIREPGCMSMDPCFAKMPLRSIYILGLNDCLSLHVFW